MFTKQLSESEIFFKLTKDVNLAINNCPMGGSYFTKKEVKINASETFVS